MSANNITRLCELAFKAYAETIGFNVIPPQNIYAGFDDEERMKTPRLVFNADSAEPDGPADDATWNVLLEVQCVSNCDDRTGLEQQEFASEVFSQFMLGRYQMPDLINAAAAGGNPVVPFNCFDIMPGSQAKVLQDRKWFSSLSFRVICCGTPGS